MAGRKRADVTATGLSAELARRLRAVRDESHLTLRQLATKSGFSASTLSLAESGRTVPSWDLLSAFVQACGKDPAGWRQLWEIAQAEATADPPPADAAVPSADDHWDAPLAETDDVPGTALQPDDLPGMPAEAPGERPEATRLGRGRVAALVGVAVLASAATAGTIVTLTSSGAAGKPATLTGQSGVTAAMDGTDPYADRCKADEKQLDWKPVLRADHSMFGTIVLMYSAACQAAWGYLDGPNADGWTTHIIAHRLPGNAAAPSQFAGAADYGSWGNVLSTRAGCVYVEAYVTDRNGPGPHARTACVQPHPPTAPLASARHGSSYPGLVTVLASARLALRAAPGRLPGFRRNP